MATAKFLDAATILVTEDDGREISVPVDHRNARYRQLLDDATAIAPADPPPPLTYREERAKAYTEQLGADGTKDGTIGDVLDAIIKHINGDPTELAAMTTTIQSIKTQFPKP